MWVHSNDKEMINENIIYEIINDRFDELKVNETKRKVGILKDKEQIFF